MEISINELRDGVLNGPSPSHVQAGIIGALIKGGHFICACCASRLCGRGLGFWLERNIFDDDDCGDTSCVVCKSPLKGGPKC